MPTHTPGPWLMEDGELFAEGRDTDASECLGIVYRTEAWTSGDPITSEDQANARLIAAAPDLLAALKDAVQQIQYLHLKFKPTGTGETTISRCLSAVAKAEAGDA